MYEPYWKLDCRPFDEVAAPRFYFPGQSHELSRLKLHYLVSQSKGIGLLVGEHGCGKSFLTRVFRQEIEESDNALVYQLLIQTLSIDDFLKYLVRQITGTIPNGDRDSALTLLEESLRKLAESGRHLVMMIDDAHLLTYEHLNLLRLLLNLRESGTGDFSILLTGRVELLSLVKKHHGLDDRISVRSSISPLTVDEIEGYVKHRLQAAGRSDVIFRKQTFEKICELSRGLPRKVNQLCDLALVVGFADQLSDIGPIEIETSDAELTSVAA